MARRSREAVQKRLRERRRAEKAEQKRLKRLARKQGRGEETDEPVALDGEPGETEPLAATDESTPVDEPAPAEPEKTE
jgi:hypothetical protein